MKKNKKENLLIFFILFIHSQCCNAILYITTRININTYGKYIRITLSSTSRAERKKKKKH